MLKAGFNMKDVLLLIKGIENSLAIKERTHEESS